MRKAIKFLLAAVGYGIFINLAKPTLTMWLGDSGIAHSIQVALVLVPMVTLLAFFKEALQNRAQNENQVDEKTMSRWELSWCGRLSLARSFWSAFVPCAIFTFFGADYVSSRTSELGPYEAWWIWSALSSVIVLLGLAILGVWRSGNRYTGKRYWVVLSRISMAIGMLAAGFGWVFGKYQ